MTNLFKQVRPALASLLLLSAVTGLVYPLVVTTLGKTLFPAEAAGSLIRNKAGEAIGSELIGQSFSEPRYFWGRPSATAPMANNAGGSSGSNQGPSNPALSEAVAARVAALRAADPGNTQPVPADLVTASASGLDPHISMAAARYQAPRVARERQLPMKEVLRLIEVHTAARDLQVLGEPRVHVLKLNLALDALSGTPR
ncbi:potassium-transporting ATPase subunit KdpC [Kinneretia aquatilis]|uniref:potassium-transporting ATPase subunit KdpC n=1 Tax=Kinneretia aquatilis TaxID=2070761 RepID=UPI00149535E4|nr:potassium-transporting ATPase subunit KdpC [Paucibacter aquatile]WIV96638.1 potassium-transporting ATPase subunit KdpC [Paucibacter aquatile]